MNSNLQIVQELKSRSSIIIVLNITGMLHLSGSLTTSITAVISVFVPKVSSDPRRF